MKKVVVSAPGKLHLSGEHAVVHGKPALVVAISKRMYITLTPTPNSKPQRLIDVRKKDAYVDSIIKTFTAKYKCKIADIGLEINSNIPVGAGLGSSAALAVTLVGALIAYFGKPWNVTEINELAYQAEKFKHKNASGSDPTVVAHGGLLWYRKELDFLKTFWLLPFKIPQSFKPFILINTGRSESTGEMVEKVGQLKKQNERKFILLITQIEEVTRALVNAVHDEKETEMRQLIKLNEQLLEDMGVVSEKVKQLIRKIEKIGGAAKISGAGGLKTGSGIVLVSSDKPKQITQIAKKYNFPSFQVTFGSEGVKREQVVV